ncbi:MAG: aspartate/glutamate racemase family protein [Geminicoccaceae bacterium]|nr:aspartate/glutamate racemase family protein [Geminicoccaceae bacterium]MCX8100594.1 aspartate/glutamate racemase family protein [Geminicoccaceae bacterium]MDW8369301.1 aspartate/glutamate racemase family protein [Geminicoccaceae bacterium]
MATEYRGGLVFRMDEGIGARARIGLVVLATDQTIEHEWRCVFGRLPGVALYESRMWNEVRITPETLAAMEGDIAAATRLIMPVLPLSVVAFGCTSAAMVLGEERIAARIHEARPGVPVTTPIGGALAALRALAARRIAVLTPYGRAVNDIVRRYLEARGLEVPVFGSFEEEDDSKVARIDPASIEAAVLELGADPRVEAVFVSCTSLRLVEAAERIERRLGKPVTSSNHAMAWHALRLAGIEDRLEGLGRLFTRPLPV